MKPFHVVLGIVAAALALILVLHASSEAAADASPAVSVGQPVPDFSAQDENGVDHKLSDYRDHLVVLEWTNPDCPFVARHYKADTMEKLATALGARGVVWLAVNSTRYNEPDDTKAWREAQGFDYPTLQDQDGALGRMFGARTTPDMFVIGPKGLLRYSGAIDDDPRGSAASPTNYVDAATAAVLAGHEPDPSETRPYGCSIKYAKN